MKFATILGLLGVLVIAGWSQAQDWPQWRGPNRDDRSEATNLLKSWPDEGPKQLWVNKESGLGYSGFAIVEGRLYTMGMGEDNTFGLCMDAKTGEEIWRTAIGVRYNNGWGDGPRSTPTVDGDQVFMLTSKGNVVCLQAKDGKQIWRKSLTKDFGGSVPRWGYSESVLVDGDKVLVTPGGKKGTVVALNRNNGDMIWQSTDVKEYAHYSSIIKIKMDDNFQYVQLTPKRLFGLSLDGKLLWSSDWHGSIAVVPTPIFHNGKVYVTSGYGAGCKQVDISTGAAKSTWQNRNMKNHHGGVILVDGHLYGFSDKRGWVCQRWDDGEIAWSEGSATFRKGAIGYAEGRFYCIEERTGKVALIEASQKGWKQVGGFRLGPLSDKRKRSGGIWVHPTIANGKLYLRDQELIYCYDISAEKKTSAK